MFRICGRTLDEQGNVADTATARCTFEERNDAVSFLNKLIQLLRPNAGYEGEQDYCGFATKMLLPGIRFRFSQLISARKSSAPPTPWRRRFASAAGVT